MTLKNFNEELNKETLGLIKNKKEIKVLLDKDGKSVSIENKSLKEILYMIKIEGYTPIPF
jgi:hypothetical protein